MESLHSNKLIGRTEAVTDFTGIVPSRRNPNTWRYIRYQFRCVQRTVRRLPRPFRVVMVLVLGGLVSLAGIAMLVLPGPGIITLLLGLSLLSTEFPWAARALRTIKSWALKLWDWTWRVWLSITGKSEQS